jgi:hypothetical protein
LAFAADAGSFTALGGQDVVGPADVRSSQMGRHFPLTERLRMTPEQQARHIVSGCQGCPWNEATHLARNGANELRLCECCAQAHDEADGWTITQLPHQPHTH